MQLVLKACLWSDYQSIKPNGKAFIIVPDGIFNRQNDKIYDSLL